MDENGKTNRELFYRDDNNKNAAILPSLSKGCSDGNLYIFFKHEQSAAMRPDWTKNFQFMKVSLK